MDDDRDLESPSKQSDGPVISSRCYTQTESLQFRHKWDVHQFSVQQEICQIGEFISSTKFGDEDYEFALKLYPNGKDDDSVGYMSIFLQINKCPLAKLQFRVNFSIETLDGPKGCALNKNIVTINKGGIVTASKFFSIDNLKARPHRFVPDDVLTIGAELTVYGATKSENAPEEFHDFSTSSVMGTSVRSLNESFFVDKRQLKVQESPFAKWFDSDKFSDFTIHSNGRSFNVHRIVLASRSRYFHAMFDSGRRESEEREVTLNDIGADTLHTVLQYMYTLKCPDVEENPSDIMFAADRLLIDGLKSQCSEVLLRGLSCTNVCSILDIADRMNEDKLFKRAIVYYVDNHESISSNSEWLDLKKTNPVLATKIMEEAWGLSEHRYPKRRRTMQ